MKKSSKTTNQKAFNKERNRLIREINNSDLINAEDLLLSVPKQPKRVTKEALKRIKSTSLEDLTKSFKTTSNIDDTISTRTKKVEPPTSTRGVSSSHPTSIRTRYAKEKVLKTTEELHDIRVTAGKKAWNTKRSNMTEQQYKEFVDKFRERVHKDKKGGTDYPYVSIYEELSNAISNIVRRAYIYVPLDHPKNVLIQFLNGEYADTVFSGNTTYWEYIEEKREEIFELIHYIETVYDSKGEKVRNAILNLTVLIKGSPLTQQEANESAEFSEALEGDEDYES